MEGFLTLARVVPTSGRLAEMGQRSAAPVHDVAEQLRERLATNQSGGAAGTPSAPCQDRSSSPRSGRSIWTRHPRRPDRPAMVLASPVARIAGEVALPRGPLADTKPVRAVALVPALGRAERSGIPRGSLTMNGQRRLAYPCRAADHRHPRPVWSAAGEVAPQVGDLVATIDKRRRVGRQPP